MPNVRAVRAAIDKTLDIAGQLTGSALAAALTVAMPGLAGSIIAAVSRQALTAGLSEALARRPTTTETRGILNAAEAALVALGRYADEGIWPRTDGFLEDQINDRSHADEVIEAVLGAAKSSFEERKTALLGELLAFITVTPAIDPMTANRLVGTAESLAWLELQLMSAFGAPKQFRMPEG